MFTIPDSVLTQMRTQAQSTMRDTVSFYSVTVGYDAYGQEIVSSGFILTTSGLIAAPREKEHEIITSLRDDGLLQEETNILLIPFAQSGITLDHVMVKDGREWNIISSNINVTDEYQLYHKLIITRDIVKSPYKRKNTQNG